MILPLTALLTQSFEGLSLVERGFAIGDVISATIFFILMFKYGYGGVVKRDMIAIFLAAIGFILWFIEDESR